MSGPKDLRAKSKDGWNSESNSLDAINAGSLQRIADATEKMAQRHTELIRDRDMFERRMKSEQACSETLRRRLNAAKGQITKLRKQLAAAKATGVQQ